MRVNIAQKAIFEGKNKNFELAFRKILLGFYSDRYYFFSDMDFEEGALREKLLDRRMDELKNNKTPIPFIAFGLKPKNKFLKNPMNMVFNHYEFGYCYISKPFSLYRFFVEINKIREYKFPDGERFKLHINDFFDKNEVIRSLIHGIREDSLNAIPKEKLQDIFLKIELLIDDDQAKKEIQDCVKNNFPLDKTIALINKLE